MEIQSDLLLEETRAVLHMEILGLQKPRTDRALSVSHTSMQNMLYIDIDLNSTGGCSHIVRDGDLFLWSSQDLRKPDHNLGCLAIATGIGRNVSYLRSFRVLVSECHEDLNFEEVKYVIFLSNIMWAIGVSKAVTSILHGNSAAVGSILSIVEKV